jgi:hypothetical protein
MVKDEQNEHEQEEDDLSYLTSMVEDEQDEHAKEEDVLFCT